MKTVHRQRTARLLFHVFLIPALAFGMVFPSVASASRHVGRKRTATPDYQAPGTRRMAARLAELGRNGNKEIAAHMPNLDLAPYLEEVTRPPDLRSTIIQDAKAAYDLLAEGKNTEAALNFLAVKELASENGSLLGPDFLNTIRELLAISYLRVGEEQSNQAAGDQDACVALLSGGAGYSKQDWSRAAIAEYMEILGDKPGDLTARWLLNLSYMTIGKYPGGVPRQYLIPPRVFKSEYEMPRFPDVAPRLGLNAVGRAGGGILEDFDGDGYVDIMVSSVGLRDQLRFYHNNADGTFTERTREAGLTGITGGLNITSADYNNDGLVDVFVPRGAWLGPAGHHPPSLLRNNGDGTFDDVTEEAHLLTLRPSHNAVWADYDNDGFLDLFLGTETIPGYNESNPCQLFHNNRDGTFTDVAEQAGLAIKGWVKGAAWGDYDNDGLPDLYISRLFEPNLLFHNDGAAPGGHWKFTDATSRAGVSEPLASFPCWFFDYDNDGWLDIFVSSCPAEDFSHVAGQVAADYLGLPTRAETPRLYRNNHDGTFSNVTREVRLNRPLYTMGANFGDIDNDGWPDIYLGTGNPMFQSLMPNRMFRNAGGRFFQDVTTSGGFGDLQKGHGIAFGDLDNDGDQDIFAVFGGVYQGDSHQRVLFENPGNANNWVTLRLEGVKSNRFGVGARIRVRVKTPQGPRDIYALGGTGGSLGSSTLQQEIGLGRDASIESIEIKWPGAKEPQILQHIRANQIVKIREGSPLAQTVPLKTFHLGGDRRPGMASVKHTPAQQRARRGREHSAM
jgi:hypothetical protein